MTKMTIIMMMIIMMR